MVLMVGECLDGARWCWYECDGKMMYGEAPLVERLMVLWYGRYTTAWHCSILGMVGYGMVRYGMVWYGMVW